jgi:FAD synthetase
VAVVADSIADIAEEVRRFAASYDYVLTTGGIGPTHDDVTLEAVGMAFQEESKINSEILNFLFGVDGDDLTSPWRKMAIAPKSTKVHLQPTTSFMLPSVHNVHCYPGVPSMLKELFQANKDLYNKGSGGGFHLRELFVGCGEDSVANPLSLVQSEYPAVQLGSYPSTSSTDSHRVKLTLESENKHLMDKAYIRLVLLLPRNVMLSSLDHPDSPQSSDPRKEVGWLLARLSSGIASLFPRSLCGKIQHTLATIEETYRRYSFDEVCVAFNGGKDCTAMLDLLHAYLTEKDHDFSEHKLKVLYITHTTQFPEVERFVEQSVPRYSLDLVRISGLGMRDALCQLKQSHPHLKAIMMGTRHTDPFSSELSDFSPTDSSWPDFMRINCFLDWSYLEVWLFLRIMAIPYCSLYDRGYSSLDGMDDTLPNSHLAITTDTTCIPRQPGVTSSYLPAYMLANENHERAGRTAR